MNIKINKILSFVEHHQGKLWHQGHIAIQNPVHSVKKNQDSEPNAKAVGQWAATVQLVDMEAQEIRIAKSVENIPEKTMFKSLNFRVQLN